MNAKDRRLSLQYSVFQFGYWVDYLIAFSFGAVLLAGRGFPPTEIGYVTTIGALLTIVLQSGLSTLADRSEKIMVRGILTCLILGCAAVAILLVLSVCAFSEMPAVFLGVPLLKRLTAARMLRISASLAFSSLASCWSFPTLPGSSCWACSISSIPASIRFLPFFMPIPS